MHMPALTPVTYEAGLDLKLAEANGWRLAYLESRAERITIQRGLAGAWYVMNGEGVGLRRPEAEGEPIAFCIGLANATPSLTAADALDLLMEYLNQPMNPYLWIRQNAD